MKNQQKLSAHVYPPIHQYLQTVETNYCEIGVFNGIGLAEIAHNNLTKSCIGIDPFIEDGNTVAATGVIVGEAMPAQELSTLAYLAESPNVTLYKQTSHEFRAELTPKEIKRLNIGVVLIDGDHHYEFVKNDYELAMELIDDKSGYIIFDDLDISGVGLAYVEFLQQYEHRILREEQLEGAAKGVYINEHKKRS